MSNARRDEAPTSPKSDRVRSIRALDRRALRYERGEFRAEGPQAVREALRADSVKHLYVTADFARDEFVDGVVVSDEVLAAMVDVTTPQGVVAVCTLPRLSLNALTKAKLILVAHEVRDPGNLGTMIRTADAAGADAVIVTGDSVDPWAPKTVRSAAGSHWHIPVLNEIDLSELAQWLRHQQIPLVATQAEAKHSFDERDLTKPVAWLVGNEAHGLDEASAALADQAAHLPIYGKAESLNVALAAGILLYASAQAQRHGAH